MTKNRFVRTVYALAATSALAAAFLVASVRPLRAQNPVTPSAMTDTLKPQQQSNKEAGHSYWRDPSYDSILDLWQDSGGIHFRVHAINPDNPKVREMVAKDLKKEPSALTDSDFTKAASYVAKLVDMKQDKDGKWRGKIWIESRKEHFGIDVQLPTAGQQKLSIRGYIIEGWKKFVTFGNPGNVVGKSMEFAPVENPPPRGVQRPVKEPEALIPLVPAPVPPALRH